MKLLRRILLAVIVMVLIFSGTFAFVSNNLTDNAVTATTVLRLEGQRAQLVETVAGLASQLVNCPNGLVGGNPCNVTLVIIGDSVNTLASVNNELQIHYPPESNEHVRLCCCFRKRRTASVCAPFFTIACVVVYCRLHCYPPHCFQRSACTVERR